MIALAGVACGAMLFLAFRRFTDRAAIREWKRKRRAYVLSLYLYGDDPLISLRSFGHIARANALLLLHALPALVIAAPLVGGVAVYLDRAMSRPVLPAGTLGVVTAHRSGTCEPKVVAPAWLRVDAPPVHIPASGEVSWRVRAVARGSGPVRVGCGGQWTSAEIASEEPSEPWIAWFGVITWATAWLLGLGDRLLRLRA